MDATFRKAYSERKKTEEEGRGMEQ